MKTTPTSRTLVYAVLALVMLGATGAHRIATRSPIDATAYHDKVKVLVEAVPYRIGEWEGQDVAIPSAAIALLRPNAMLSRVYRRPSDRAMISLAIIQCRDSRDMAGHYPPICYPAHGWTVGETSEGLTISGVATHPLARYTFLRPTEVTDTSIVIYNVLILPGVGPASSMKQVREAAGNPQTRPLGAAQIQIVVPADITERGEETIVRDILGELRPVIDAIVAVQ